MKTYNLTGCNINEALTLAEDLLRLAKGRKLHPRIVRALRNMRATRDALEEASRARDGDGPPSAPPRQPQVAVRSVFASMGEVLRAHAEVAVDAEIVAEAKQTYAAVFPQGTAFLRGTMADLDVQCGRVLDRAQDEENATSIERLGCGALLPLAIAALADLRRARQASATAVAEATADRHAVFMSALDALRDYALAVQAIDVAEDTAQHEELLAPLANRRAPRRGGSAPQPAGSLPATVREPGLGAIELEPAPSSRAA